LHCTEESLTLLPAHGLCIAPTAQVRASIMLLLPIVGEVKIEGAADNMGISKAYLFPRNMKIGF
jgi:hypothetical protein